MKKYYFQFLLILFSSCNLIQKTDKQENEISKICFASNGCFGTCPHLAIEIDSSLNYRFLGGSYSEMKGLFEGKISRGFWDTLNLDFNKINYKKLDSTYLHSVDDVSIETIIFSKGNKKHILAQSSSLPDSIRKVFFKYLNSYKFQNLVKQKENKYTIFTFETTYQYGIPPREAK